MKGRQSFMIIMIILIVVSLSVWWYTKEHFDMTYKLGPIVIKGDYNKNCSKCVYNFDTKTLSCSCLDSTGQSHDTTLKPVTEIHTISNCEGKLLHEACDKTCQGTGDVCISCDDVINAYQKKGWNAENAETRFQQCKYKTYDNEIE